MYGYCFYCCFPLLVLFSTCDHASILQTVCIALKGIINASVLQITFSPSYCYSVWRGAEILVRDLSKLVAVMIIKQLQINTRA